MSGYGPPNVVPPENSHDPPPAPAPPQGGDPPPSPPFAPGPPLNDIEGYESDISDIWAGIDGFDIWGWEDDVNASDSDSVVSVIDVPESPKIIAISSDEDS